MLSTCKYRIPVNLHLPLLPGGGQPNFFMATSSIVVANSVDEFEMPVQPGTKSGPKLRPNSWRVLMPLGIPAMQDQKL